MVLDKLNDNLITFDNILGEVRNLQESMIVNSWKLKFKFVDQHYDKKFNKQISNLRGKLKKTKNFEHGLKNAWDVMDRTQVSENSEEGMRISMSESEESDQASDFIYFI